MKKVRILIYGRVTGVSFRYFIEENAYKLNIKGWVKNIGYGKVEAVFEGEDNAVDKLVELCIKGPWAAKVDNLELKKEKYKEEFKDFRVVY